APAAEQLAEQRNDAVEPDPVERREEPARGRDLEDPGPAARGEHAAQLGQTLLQVGDVADAEADGRRLERPGLEREGEQITLDPRRLGQLAPRAREHPRREVEPRHLPGARLARRDREVPGAAAGVEDAVARPNDRLGRDPPPAEVEPGGHHAVHRVVDRGDPVEHAPDVGSGKPTGGYVPSSRVEGSDPCRGRSRHCASALRRLVARTCVPSGHVRGLTPPARATRPPGTCPRTSCGSSAGAAPGTRWIRSDIAPDAIVRSVPLERERITSPPRSPCRRSSPARSPTRRSLPPSRAHGRRGRLRSGPRGSGLRTKRRERPLCRGRHARAHHRAYFPPFDASRKTAIERIWALVNCKPNRGMTLFPNLLGSAMYAASPCTPRPLVPSLLRSGAPRLEEPVPRYVWHVEHPAWVKSFAPASACWFPSKPCFFAHSGGRLASSLASASFAVAPLYVRTPIEITVRIVITTATGRRDSLRSRRMSMNGSSSISTMMIVGIPTVPRITESGHLKIRSR